MTSHKELFALADKLGASADAAEKPPILNPMNALLEAANRVGRSFSGSWLGYHARIYYAGFGVPPPGARFSQEWGLDGGHFGGGSRGDWREMAFDDVKEHIRSLADGADLTAARSAAAEAEATLQAVKPEIESILQVELSAGADSFLENLRDQLKELAPVTPLQVADQLHNRTTVMTRDTTALGQGTQLPPHISVSSEIRALGHSFAICAAAAAIARKAASHLERKQNRQTKDRLVGTNVFIGHGRSVAWRDVKDFVQDRLRLPWDEFNRVPVAGVTNIARLQEMMDAAAIAFLVMTAEDERADGKMQARMNVIHEAGLFQGRLGFSKAIVLLEEGCEEFSNIAGLGQIRFPPGSIKSVFEDIRRVLEREKLIP